jgi:serine protease AprX
MTRAFRRFSCAFVLLATVVGAPQATVNAAGPRVVQHRDRLDATLRGVLDQGAPKPQRVIIRVRPGSRLALRQGLTAHGDQILAEHDSLDALTAVVHGQDLGDIVDKDFVLSVSSDAIVQADGLLGGVLGIVGTVLKVVVAVVDDVVGIVLPNGADTSGPPVPPVVLRQTLGVNNSNWTGQGIGVAIIDSGLEMSSEFSGRVTAFYDFTTGGIVASYPYDDYGHGTHVAGTIGGSGALSSNRDYRGLAPNVKLVVLKVLDENGAGYTSDVIRAVDYAVANRVRLGIQIINLSLGHPIFEPASSDPLVQAVERATRAGVIVVAAAGNYGKNVTTGLPGYAGITSPGNAPSAITVGAVRTLDTVVRSDDRIPDYSSAGPTWYDAFAKPDILAPGHNIIAMAAKQGTLYKTYPQLKAADGDYMRLSGTSMATAVASGSIALMLEANRYENYGHPTMTPNAVKAVLQYTAVGIHDDLGVEYNPLRKGAGALNGKGAIDLGRSINTSRPTGQYWLTSASAPWTVIGGETNTWNQGIIWGSSIIWGTSTSYNETAWGTSIIWGTNDTTSIIWGTSQSDSIIWGTNNGASIIWGTNVVWTNSSSWSEGIIWGSDTIGRDNGSSIIWGTNQSDSIIWGTGAGVDAQSTHWKALSGNSTTATGQ